MRRKLRNLFGLMLSIGALGNPYTLGWLRQSFFDLTHDNPTVIDKSAIRNLLEQLEQIPYHELDSSVRHGRYLLAYRSKVVVQAIGTARETCKGRP